MCITEYERCTFEYFVELQKYYTIYIVLYYIVYSTLNIEYYMNPKARLYFVCMCVCVHSITFVSVESFFSTVTEYDFYLIIQFNKRQ